MGWHGNGRGLFWRHAAWDPSNCWLASNVLPSPSRAFHPVAASPLSSRASDPSERTHTCSPVLNHHMPPPPHDAPLPETRLPLARCWAVFTCWRPSYAEQPLQRRAGRAARLQAERLHAPRRKCRAAPPSSSSCPHRASTAWGARCCWAQRRRAALAQTRRGRRSPAMEQMMRRGRERLARLQICCWLRRRLRLRLSSLFAPRRCGAGQQAMGCAGVTGSGRLQCGDVCIGSGRTQFILLALRV